MRYAILGFLLAAGQALAVSGPLPVDPADPSATAQAGAVAAAGAAAGAVAGAEAAGGDATSVANGGQASGGNGGSASGVGEVNVRGDDYDRPAPAVGLVPPVSTMDCIRGFGVGGSNVNGSLVIGPTWKDGDCMALKQFEQLSGLGLAYPAAVAYCDRPRFAAPFGGEPDCVQAMSEQIRYLHTPAREVVEVPDQACNEKLRRCEAVTK